MQTDPSKPALLLFYHSREEFILHAKEAFDELEKSYSDGIDFIRVELQPGCKLEKTFRIVETPTLVAFLDGRELWRRTGFFLPEDVPVSTIGGRHTERPPGKVSYEE